MKHRRCQFCKARLVADPDNPRKTYIGVVTKQHCPHKQCSWCETCVRAKQAQCRGAL